MARTCQIYETLKKKRVYFCSVEPKLFLQHVYLLMGVDAKTVEIEPLTQGLMDLIDPA